MQKELRRYGIDAADCRMQFLGNIEKEATNLHSFFIEGTEKTIYFNSASIGEIPKYITENNIVVASSNNGAVQNIVNELPLNKGIDASLIEKLREADYFREIANARVSAEWMQDENGKKREELVKESVSGEEKFFTYVQKS